MGQNSKPGIEIANEFPQYFRLYDHDKFITVIKLSNSSEYSEVLTLINNALQTCTHEFPGDCARIEKTTIGEYLLVHSGFGAGD